MFKIHWLHHGLWWLYCMNVCTNPFYQCKVTLNTISLRMKSTSRVEVCCSLAAGVPQGSQNQCFYFKTLHTHFKNTHINPFVDQKPAVFKNKSPIFKNKFAVQKWTVEQVGTHRSLIPRLIIIVPAPDHDVRRALGPASRPTHTLIYLKSNVLLRKKDNWFILKT